MSHLYMILLCIYTGVYYVIIMLFWSYVSAYEHKIGETSGPYHMFYLFHAQISWFIENNNKGTKPQCYNVTGHYFNVIYVPAGRISFAI